jgi:hypothetical protein
MAVAYTLLETCGIYCKHVTIVIYNRYTALAYILNMYCASSDVTLS